MHLSSPPNPAFRPTLESVGGFQILDSTWRVVYLDPAAQESFARSEIDSNGMIGKNFWKELMPDSIESELARHLFRAMEEQIPVAFENYCESRNSWFLWQANPIPEGGLAVQFQNITERKAAEEQLKRREELLAEAEQVAHLGSWSWDCRTGDVMWSDEHYRILGLSPQEMESTLELGLNSVHPDDRAAVQCRIDQALRDHQPFECDWRAVQPNGAVQFVHSRGQVDLDEQGEPARMFGTLQARREPRKVEPAPRRQEWQAKALLTLLQLQFERMPVACIISDLDMQILEWNPAAETTFGYRREEVIGRNGFLLLFPASNRHRLREVRGRLAAGDMDAHSVNENLTKDGRTILCDWRNTPLRDTDGRVIAILAIGQDITERARADRALRESVERYRALVSQVRDYAIFSTDEIGVITSWNEGCQQVLGYTEPEFLGMTFAELFTSSDRAGDIPAANLREAGDSGSVRHERWILRRGGIRIYAVGVTTGLRDYAGRLLGFSTVLRDHTHVKLAQVDLANRSERLERLVTQHTKELEKARDRLRLSERIASLGTLAAGLGHDLGNLLLPLDARLSFLEAAGLSPDLVEHVTGLRTCAEYLHYLAKGLRLLSADAGKEGMSAPTQLRAWWNDVRTIMKGVLPRGIRLEEAIANTECSVLIDTPALTQAVFNLVQNAADSLRDRGAGFIRVSAHERPHQGTVVLRVTDNGPGMSEEVLRRCVELYFSTKTRGSSTGMGLSIVEALVSAVGGRIEIDSSVGKGTTIGLVVPLAPAREKMDASAFPVAVIDLSDSRTRSLVGGVLRTLGFDVIESGQASPRPSLLVIDPAGLARQSNFDALEARVILVGDVPTSAPALQSTRCMVLGPNPDPTRICQVLRQAAEEIGLVGV